MGVIAEEEHGPLTALRRRWGFIVGLYGVALFSGYLVLKPIWPYATRWLMISVTVSMYLLYVCWNALSDNRQETQGRLLPTLGFANALSLVRGIAIAAMAGFLGSPWPDGLLGWVPLGLAVLCFIADCFDGYVARLTHHVTVLGEKLDMEFDKVGVLIGIALAVYYGQLPMWYLLLGFGGHIFSLTFWLRTRHGLRIHDLPPSVYRRLFAGIQMWTISSVLLPVIPPDIASFTGTLTGALAAVVFITDWLIVCGYVNPYHPRYKKVTRFIHILLTRWLTLVLRIGLVVCLVLLLKPFANPFQPQAWIDLYRSWGFPFPSPLAMITGTVTVIGVFAVAFGFLPRLWTMLLVYPIYFEAARNGLQIADALALASCILLVIFGFGRFTVWRPDDIAMNRYIYRGFD